MCLRVDTLRKLWYNDRVRWKDMEKLVVEFGLGIVCFFFLCMIVIGSQFLWGVLAGLLVMGFGWFFWDE